MQIRHADPDEHAAGCAAVYAPYVLDTVTSFEEQPPDSAEFARRIERLSVRYPWLVAEQHGDVAGYAYASTHRERAAYRWTADVAVYISSQHHRRGIGGALYRTLLDLLVRQGVQVACAGITLPNEASVALHESYGFRHVGTYRRIGWKAGAWRDVGWWELELIERVDGPPPEPEPPATLPEPLEL
jgi:phosphinothricin acetyltransferase